MNSSNACIRIAAPAIGRSSATAPAKLKWVDEIAQTVREESYDKNPDAPSAPAGIACAVPARAANPRCRNSVDANGHRYVLLPRLDPVDCYYLYNPDNYYRLTP